MKNKLKFKKWMHIHLEKSACTQITLSKKTGIHKNLISRYCRGINYPNIPHFYFICVVFAEMQGVQLEDLLCEGIKYLVGGGPAWNI